MTLPLPKILLIPLTCLALCACLELDPVDQNKPLPEGLFPDTDINLTPPPRCTGSATEPSPLDLKMYFIDVGQGDAILIQTPDDGIPGNNTAEGYTVLIDAGDNGFFERTDGYLYVNRWLERLDIDTIDYAIVTHAHSDHFGGMTRLFGSYNVTNVIDPGFDNDITTYKGYLTSATQETQENGGQLIRPTTSSLADILATIDLGDELEATILHGSPSLGPGSNENSRINNTSIVLKLSYARVRALFMGDAEEEIEEQLLAAGTDLNAEILKVGHHGSNTSNTQEFLDAVWNGIAERNRYAVISAGRTEFSGIQLPTENTVVRLRQALGGTENEGNSRLFSTENEDDEKDESDAAGDDNVLITVNAEGVISGCYIQ